MNSSNDAIKTGFSAIDVVTGGLKSSEMMVIAGQGRTGKTSLALSIAKNVAVDEKTPCAFFSMEMSNVKLVNRLISSVCDIDGGKILNGQLNYNEWEKLDEHISRLTEAPLYINDESAPSIDELGERMRKFSSEHGVKLFIIDYLQLIDCHKHNRSDELFECMRSLRELADELGVTIITTSKLGSGTEEKHRYPKMSDHQEFMVFNDYVDYSVFLYRLDHYYVSTVDKRENGLDFGRLTIAKRGFEQIGDGLLRYNREQNAFVELEPFSFALQRKVTDSNETPKWRKTIMLLQGNGNMMNVENHIKDYFINDNVIVPQIKSNPDEDLPYIRLMCQEYHPDLIIGVELGAIYAIKLHEYRRICINPSSWSIPRGIMNCQALENLDYHLLDDLSEESRRKCWGIFISEIPYNVLRERFIPQFFPNVIDIPRNGRDDIAIIHDVILPFAKMLLNEEWTDEWGVTYSSYGRILKKVDPLLFTCEDYTIPEGVEEMEDSFWLTEAKLRRIQLPSTLRKMDVNTFIRCPIEEIELPEGITEVPDYMCESCEYLEKVVLPPTIKRINHGAFNCCIKLPTIDLPDSIETIDCSVFRYCESLKSVILPPKITSLGDELFYFSGIESIEIHKNIKEIGQRVFCGCNHLKRLVIPETVESISYGIVSAHEGFEGITCYAKGYHVENDALIDDERQELLCCWTQQKDYVVPECVKSIADFSCNPYVETITVKQPVELNGYDTFASDANLKRVDFQGGVTGMTSQTFYNCPKIEN